MNNKNGMLQKVRNTNIQYSDLRYRHDILYRSTAHATKLWGLASQPALEMPAGGIAKFPPGKMRHRSPGVRITSESTVYSFMSVPNLRQLHHYAGAPLPRIKPVPLLKAYVWGHVFDLRDHRVTHSPI